MSPCRAAESTPCLSSLSSSMSTILFVLVKMSIWSPSDMFATILPRAHILFRRPTFIANWSISGTSTSRSSLMTWTGSLVNSSVASRTSWGNVALNRRVCLLPTIFSTIHRTSGKNPMSSILSASSRQNISIAGRSMCPLLLMSMTLPGVPTMTSTPLSSSFACLSKSVPPYTVSILRLFFPWSLDISSATCTASSLVGQSTSDCKEPSGSHDSIMGIPKAAVLPDPVRAWPTTSLPLRATGIDSV